MDTNKENKLDRIHDLVDAVTACGIEAPFGLAANLHRYAELVRQGNRHTQLVSRQDEAHLVERHLAESLAPATVYPLHAVENLMDLGSGGGLPGIPLALLFPELPVSLLEPRLKKSVFLKLVCRELRLDNVTVLADRVENLHDQYREAFALIIARAVAPLDQLWAWTAPLLHRDGTFLAMKGGDVEAECDALTTQQANLFVKELHYPETLVARNKNRKLLVIRTSVDMMN